MFVGFDVDIESDEAPERFARMLASHVNDAGVHLAAVIAAERAVHAVSDGPPMGLTVRTCRFRVRRHGDQLDEGDLAALLGRIGRRYMWTALRPVQAESSRSAAA